MSVSCCLALAVATPAGRALAEGYPTVDGLFSGTGRIGPGSVFNLTVLGRGGVPASGVDAVALNVTATNASLLSYLTVWPAGAAQPTASNLNFVAGQTVPNMVIAKVGASGQVSIFNLAGTVDVVVDVLGYFPTGGSFTGLSPARVLETRPDLPTSDGLFQAVGPIGAGGVLNLTVLGRGGVPASGVDAVALNVTATNASLPSYLTVWPAGAAQPTASNLNFVAGQTVPNMVIAKVGASGQVSIFNLAGTVDVVVDVLGYFPTGGSFTGLSPARLMDSRVVISSPPAAPPPPSPPSPPSPSPPPPPSPPSPPPPPEPQVLTFQAGVHVVNSEMPPGRYVAMSAQSGCYWERLSGFGGSLDEILANNFQGFSGPVIVDVLATDAGFSFTASCGSFKSYVPTNAFATTIAPGNYVVGNDVIAGTYSTLAASGCYWSRNSSFDGTLDSIIANDFVSAAGQQVVTISPTDVGFYTDADCGTWSRIGP